MTQVFATILLTSFRSMLLSSLSLATSINITQMYEFLYLPCRLSSLAIDRLGLRLFQFRTWGTVAYSWAGQGSLYTHVLTCI